MKLYFAAGACSMAPHIVLREAAYTFDLESVDLAKKQTASGEDYTRINPKGYVPALRLDNGEVLTEVAVILQYLADQKPESGLAPKTGTMERYRPRWGWAMTEASLQAVMREGLNRYRGSHRLSPHQWQVCHHILDCRTEALGGLGLDCDHCDQRVPHYYACRDRHCPRCQRRASQTWCERQQAAVLPATYHHLVFTLPHALNPWVQLHPEVIYALLFETVWATLSAFGADPKRLGGQLGMTAVLHTWGQTLSQHVHLHCLIPGGAFSPQGRWHPAKSTYLFPVRALSRHIRGGFVSRLRRQLKAGELPRLEDRAQIGALLDTLMAADWVVYSKPCLTHTETVVDYLARYSHRIALTDGRIVNRDGDRVQLDYKDYRDGSRHKIMTLAGEELLRRFLLHVLPKGFMRIRHFGFLANRCRAERIEAIRAALNLAQQQPEPTADAGHPAPFDGYPCPLCRKGRLRITAHLAPKRDEGG